MSLGFSDKLTLWKTTWPGVFTDVFVALHFYIQSVEASHRVAAVQWQFCKMLAIFHLTSSLKIVWLALHASKVISYWAIFWKRLLKRRKKRLLIHHCNVLWRCKRYPWLSWETPRERGTNISSLLHVPRNTWWVEACNLIWWDHFVPQDIQDSSFRFTCHSTCPNRANLKPWDNRWTGQLKTINKQAKNNHVTETKNWYKHTNTTVVYFHMRINTHLLLYESYKVTMLLIDFLQQNNCAFWLDLFLQITFWPLDVVVASASSRLRWFNWTQPKHSVVCSTRAHPNTHTPRIGHAPLMNNAAPPVDRRRLVPPELFRRQLVLTGGRRIMSVI